MSSADADTYARWTMTLLLAAAVRACPCEPRLGMICYRR
jgi:hypothetical protein